MTRREKPLAYITLDLIADRWNILVINHLANGEQRYSQLEKNIEGISAKMLTQSLRNLEYNGIVHRHVYRVMPQKVGYTLTYLGESLVPLLKSLHQWASDNLDDVMKARADYTAAVPGEEMTKPV